MRALLQRVSEADVTIDGQVTGSIGPGLVALVAFEDADSPEDLGWMSGKIIRMRIFQDAQGLMNQSLLEVAGGLLVISQFTLYASTKKGNRPSYLRSAKPETAVPLYQAFLRQAADDLGRPVAAGIFGAHMAVRLINDGPVTIGIDSKNRE